MQTQMTVLWATSDGVSCVLAPYDEDRYHLRMLRPQGTVKTDLFDSYTLALAAADNWRRALSDRRPIKRRGQRGVH
jgi:hypothetical protein